MPLKIFGKLPSGERLNRIRKSPNYKDEIFQNLSETKMMSEDTSYLKMTKEFFSKQKSVEPDKILPTVKTDLKDLKSDKPTVVWFGHSSYLLKIEGKVILVDPVLSGNAAPFSTMVKSFKGTDVYTVDDFPEIDILLLTHDHYDHLDYKTIKKLKSKVKQVCCSLGVASHLDYWGYDINKIIELDWWDEKEIEGLKLTAAPARHFSGRGLTRAKTLWSSFVLKSSNHQLYLGGDSGYDYHFKKIGEKFGRFDLAILECGQYNVKWPLIHMAPEEVVKAGMDLKAKVLLPVHWAKFALAFHPWNEPIERFIKEAQSLNIKYTTPMIGEPLIIDESYPLKRWWD